MSARPIVLYSNPEDSLVHVLKNQINADLIFLDEITRYVDLGEWPHIVSHRYPEDLIARFDGAHLHNRVFSLAHTEIGARLKDKHYKELWAYVALRPLLAKAAVLEHDSGPRGVSRGLLPLNTQWMHMAAANIATPKYVYVFGGQAEVPEGLVDPVRKSIWSLHEWRDETRMSAAEGIWHPFFVERPTGTPVVCNYLADDVDFFFPNAEVDVDRDAYVWIAQSASAAFRSRSGEFLTYVESDGTVRFYAFSPTLSGSLGEAGVRERLGRYFEQSDASLTGEGDRAALVA